MERWRPDPKGIAGSPSHELELPATRPLTATRLHAPPNGHRQRPELQNRHRLTEAECRWSVRLCPLKVVFRVRTNIEDRNKATLYTAQWNVRVCPLKAAVARVQTNSGYRNKATVHTAQWNVRVCPLKAVVAKGSDQRRLQEQNDRVHSPEVQPASRHLPQQEQRDQCQHAHQDAHEQLVPAEPHREAEQHQQRLQEELLESRRRRRQTRLEASSVMSSTSEDSSAFTATSSTTSHSLMSGHSAASSGCDLEARRREKRSSHHDMHSARVPLIYRPMGWSGLFTMRVSHPLPFSLEAELRGPLLQLPLDLCNAMREEPGTPGHRPAVTPPRCLHDHHDAPRRSWRDEAAARTPPRFSRATTRQGKLSPRTLPHAESAAARVRSRTSSDCTPACCSAATSIGPGGSWERRAR
ncbi:hypothetical protein MRX96_040994 [Rhipicephalus microplus]